jgi:hypothetical protein
MLRGALRHWLELEHDMVNRINRGKRRKRGGCILKREFAQDLMLHLIDVEYWIIMHALVLCSSQRVPTSHRHGYDKRFGYDRRTVSK